MHLAGSVNTMNYAKINLCYHLVKRVISRYFCEHMASPLHISSSESVRKAKLGKG